MFQEIIIEDIKKIDKNKVYDIEVEDVHHYFINDGVLSHNSQSFIPQTIMGGGCLTPGHKVFLGDGTLINIEDIKEGDEVLTYNGKNVVEKTWEFEKEIYEVEFEDGTTLKCSVDHRFLIKNEGDINSDDNWEYISKLNVGDEILIKNTELGKLKIKNIKKLGCTKVVDLTVANENHYITENGVINHNTGARYAASVVMYLSKAQLKEKENKTGIIVTAKPDKNRFAKPNPIKFHIHYTKGVNPYVGLEQFCTWDICGIAKGKIEKGEKIQSATARGWICKHLDYVVPNEKFFTAEVFTDEVLKQIDEYIKPMFNYGIDEVDDLNNALDGIFEVDDDE